jgi:hypothetical protein
MTTFTTKMLAAVAVVALALGSATAGDKKGGGKPSNHSGPSKPTKFEKPDFKKFEKHDKFDKYDKHDFKKYDKHDFHFKWYPSCYPGFCWFPAPCYPWFCPPGYPYGMRPIDPGIGNGYPVMKSYK